MSFPETVSTTFWQLPVGIGEYQDVGLYLLWVVSHSSMSYLLCVCVFAELQALPYQRKYFRLKIVEQQSHKLRMILCFCLSQDDGHALIFSISQYNLIHTEYCLFFHFLYNSSKECCAGFMTHWHPLYTHLYLLVCSFTAHQSALKAWSHPNSYLSVLWTQIKPSLALNYTVKGDSQVDNAF